jgi:NAD(P) transhydrogenase subunit beta
MLDTLRDSPNFFPLAYLLAASTFIVGLKRLGHPRTARNGNFIAAAGMALALIVTLISPGVEHYGWIAIGVAVGAVPGWYFARSVKMTAMPQMVALFNGVGGGAIACIALSEVKGNALSLGSLGGADILPNYILLGYVASAAIGAVSFSGSMIAFAKLQELIGGKPMKLPGQQIVNLALLIGMIVFSVLFFQGEPTVMELTWVVVLALVLGVGFVMPIGGADMPVIISLLNSFTGTAAALAGFALHNSVLIIAGSLVGASGFLLTKMMGEAMNRPITNVLFAGVGGGAAAGPVTGTDGTVRAATADDVAIMLAYARQAVIVPGYGLAVSQAQHTVRELTDLLEQRGVRVLYGIHPVAGRMPGHMNVLLAEANVPYDHLKEMEEVNPEFKQTDVVLVIGANDVVNPAARTVADSPLFGMPILNVDEAQQVVVLKRGMSAGFAGVENPLFVLPNTSMLFGDAKASLTELVSAVSQV